MDLPIPDLQVGVQDKKTDGMHRHAGVHGLLGDPHHWPRCRTPVANGKIGMTVSLRGPPGLHGAVTMVFESVVKPTFCNPALQGPVPTSGKERIQHFAHPFDGLHDFAWQ